MFVGKSLTNIRILNDLSRNQLAEKINVTEQAIWQYENGYVSPKLEVVNKLKAIFKVKSSYFYNPDIVVNSDANKINIQNIAYRSETINSLNKTQSELMHVRFIEEFLKMIESKISYPKCLLLELRQQTINYLKENSNVKREIQIKDIAQIARKKIGLPEDSNMNLLFLLEKAGVFIFEKEIGDSIDAYSLWTEEDRPYIILGTIKKSAVRRNLDLAHELGHLLLHYKVEFTMQDKKSYRHLEDEAFAFASEFLLPEKQFKSDFKTIVKVSNPDSYIDLKQKWSVSLQAIGMRLNNLDLIDQQKSRYFFASIYKKGYKRVEPLDLEITVEKPKKIKSILQLLFEKKIYTVTSLMEDLKVDLSFLSLLTGIDEDFFRKYKEMENKNPLLSDLGIRAVNDK